jgi:hypothetical protein
VPGGDEIHGDVVFEDRDVGVGLAGLQKRADDLAAGNVPGVEDPAFGVAALLAEIEVLGLAASEIPLDFAAS